MHSKLVVQYRKSIEKIDSYGKFCIILDNILSIIRFVFDDNFLINRFVL